MAGSLSGELIESLTVGRALAGVFLFLVGSFLVDFSLKPRYPKSLPRVGYGEGTIATMKNWLGYVLHFGKWVDEGYQKYSKYDRAFIVPSAASRPEEIVVPRSQTAWMMELPDRILSTHDAHNDVLYSEYNFLGKEYSDDTFHTRVVHKNLARHLTDLIPSTEDEVNTATEEAFGKDTENWHSFNLWETLLNIVPRITNRLLVGKPACRNEVFLKSMEHFVDTVITNSLILNMFPKILHPIVGRLVMLLGWRHWRKAHNVLLPVITNRLHDMAMKESGDPLYQDWEPPEDYITWHIRLAKVEGRGLELNPSTISKRLLPIEFAAIHTTVLTGHFILLDLLASDQSRGYVHAIREETSRVLREEGGHWTKTGLLRLLRTDSAIRESQRLSNFATTLTHRKVMAKEGITNTIEGWHVPYGGFLMLNLAGVQHDPDLYENPDDYDAFRFARVREEYEAKPESDKTPEEALKVKRMGMVTTSDSHLAFGHGRHACPGRFFVAHELKMILAFLFQNYEIKPLAERPKPMWIGQTIIPPLDVKIEVKRRKVAD